MARQSKLALALSAGRARLEAEIPVPCVIGEEDDSAVQLPFPYPPRDGEVRASE